MTIALSIVGGFIALIVGGELLVRGASSLALAARVSPLVIGLTVVALGTSAPELAVSIQSCYAGVTELAIGNAVGSNVSNILLVLGSAALMAPLAVHIRLFRLDIPVMIAAAAALWLFSLDGVLARGECVILVIAMAAYLYWTVSAGRREQKVLEEQLGDLPQVPNLGLAALAVPIGQVIIGLLLLVGGANFLVDGCKELATWFGISELVIGLTVTAIGTSLPELITSIMAAMRGKRDLAVGNVVGSNILNILCVLGISGVVAPVGIDVSADAISFHIPIMLGVTIVCLPIFFTGLQMDRGEGAVMLAYYVAYIAYIAVAASAETPSTPTITTTLGFLAPLAVIAVVTMLGRGSSTQKK